MCTHPPQRLYSWFAYDCITNKKSWLVIACCDCGDVLKGDSEEYEAYLAQQSVTE